MCVSVCVCVCTHSAVGGQVEQQAVGREGFEEEDDEGGGGAKRLLQH